MEREFRIDEVFEKIDTPSFSEKANDFPTVRNGEYSIPLLTAGIRNNGLSRYARREQCPQILKNVISISANGANTGIAFYQDKEFAVLQDAYAIDTIGHTLNREKGLYLAAALSKALHGNYDWSSKANWKRIHDRLITLPATLQTVPDFDYIVNNIYIYGGQIDMTDIDTSTWKEFKISDLFEIRKVKGKTIKEYESGSIPYVSGTSSNNGIINKVSSLGNDISEGNCLTVDPITGFTAYQEEDFIGRGFSGASIVALYNENLTRENAEFFCAVIYKKIHESASYSNLYNTKRLADVTVLLPAKEEYVPDFAYMENYIKEIEKESISRMKKERERKIEAGRKAIGTEKIYAGDDEISEDVEWGEFEIGSLFDIQTSKSFNKNDVDFTVKGNCDFIGRTSAKTGIQGKCNKLYTEPNSKDTFSLVQIGERVCFYRERDWYASQNIFVLTPKFKTDRKNATFISSAVTRALKEVYGDNAYNRYPTLKTLPKLAIQLPVDRATGKPDWKYMENYISILQKKQSDKVFERLKKEYPDC